MVEIDIFKQALELSWSIETTAYPLLWTPENPSFGQCGATSLVAQDYLGGQIAFGKVLFPDRRVFPHMWNYINGKNVDFTSEQIPSMSKIRTIGEPESLDWTRSFILSNPENNRRYILLKKRLEKTLANQSITFPELNLS